MGVPSLVHLFTCTLWDTGFRVNLPSGCCVWRGELTRPEGETINAASEAPSRRSSPRLDGPEISSSLLVLSVSGNPQDKAAGNFSHLSSFISRLCWQAKLLVHLFLECNSVLQPVYNKGSFSWLKLSKGVYFSWGRSLFVWGASSSSSCNSRVRVNLCCALCYFCIVVVLFSVGRYQVVLSLFKVINKVKELHRMKWHLIEQFSKCSVQFSGSNVPFEIVAKRCRVNAVSTSQKVHWIQLTELNICCVNAVST